MDSSFPFTIEHSVLYRNPLPHVRSIHAYFPSLVAFDNNHLGASFVMGQAFEAIDLHVVYFQSFDGGRSWEPVTEITHIDPEMKSSTVGRIARSPEGELIANVARHQRRPDDTGLTQAGSIAFVPTSLEIYRSQDLGKTWAGPESIATPKFLGDTSFELCSSIRFLPNGDWFWPTSTWPIDRVDVQLFKTGGLISKDKGATWLIWQPIYPNNTFIYWESKVTPLQDGQLLSTSWVHDLAQNKDMANHYAMGYADGTHWSDPMSTGLNGQTMDALLLPDGRILAIYRRVDRPGIWATLAKVDASGWHTLNEEPLWTGERSTGDTHSMRDTFAALKCGAPSAQLLPDERVMALFWAVVDNVSQINVVTLIPKEK